MADFGAGRGNGGELPEEAAFDEAADGDEEFVAEVELPISVLEATEIEDVSLHGRDNDDLGWAVRGFVGEEQEGVSEGCYEGEDGGDSEGQGWLHVRSGSGLGIDFRDFDVSGMGGIPFCC